MEYVGVYDVRALGSGSIGGSIVEKELLGFIRARAESPYFVGFDYELEPLSSIYLHSEAEGALGPSGDIRYVYIFSTVALLILLLACVNYMNLATARSVQRAKEVGVRKTAGATRGRLIQQFLGESLLLCVVTFLLALSLARLALPIFSQLTDVPLRADFLNDPMFVLVLAGVALLVGFMAGAYPALVLSRFRAADVMKGHLRTGRGGARFRKGLVVFQFAVSVVLLIGALVVWRQLDYVQTRKLGLEEEQVVVIRTRGALSVEEAETFKNELLQSTQVTGATVSSAIPTQGAARLSVKVEGQDDAFMMRRVGMDADFLETLGIDLKAGRDFSARRPSDQTDAILLNEAAVEKLGLENFGLAAYAAERRTKEIGIRKVLGASVPSIVVLLSKDFLKLVAIAFVIAAPIAYFAMKRWLEDFAYRIDLGPWVFVGAGVLALVIALLTVSYQAIKAALADPVEALRDE